MLKPTPGEAYRHVCDRWNVESQELNIFLHDVQAYAVKKDGTWTGNIKHCPYCGVEVEKEERP